MLSAFTIVEKARKSAFYRMLLNWSLNRMIPFNKPHGFVVVELGERHIRTMLPYRKRNLNHIRGLHACALATLCEFTTGFLLVNTLDPSKYRIIMKRLEMDYHYQGKTDAFARFSLAHEWLQEKVLKPLEQEESTTVTCEVLAHDRKGNHLTTGRVHWQIKAWSSVRTKV